MKSPLNILVTAGGTREYLDDVRYLTNKSSGKFGISIANAAASYCDSVTMLLSKNSRGLIDTIDKRVNVTVFESTADLHNMVHRQSQEHQWDIVFHSAAVSDYRPIQKVEGKISSDSDEYNVTFVKNPKIISFMREWFGRKTTIVGFKLLSNASASEHNEAAMKQIKQNHTNLCIDNDLNDINENGHTVRVITPEGGSIEFHRANKDELALNVYGFVKNRNDVDWFKTVYTDSVPVLVKHKNAERLLSVCQDSNLLSDENGNMSAYVMHDLFLITPRGVDKSKVKAIDLIPASVDLNAMTVSIAPNKRKASIDSSVAGFLYQNLKLKATIHTHSLWGVGAEKTRFQYPCGVMQEAVEVFAMANVQYFKQPDHINKSFLVEMINHGLILGIADDIGGINGFCDQYSSMVDDFNIHLNEVSVTRPEGKLYPILYPNGIAGHVFVHNDGCVSPRIMEHVRGKGYGKEIVKIIKDQCLTVKTMDQCRVVDFYVDHGFQVIDITGKEIRLR